MEIIFDDFDIINFIFGIISFIIAVIGTSITTFALLYAYKTNREKKKLENLINFKLVSISENIQNIIENPCHADDELLKIHNLAKVLKSSKEKDDILFHAHMSARDVTASARMLTNLYREVQSLQKGLFDMY